MDIKFIRNQTGLTQEELADFLDISRPQVAKLELSMRIPRKSISLLLTRIDLAIVQYHLTAGITSINNAIPHRVFEYKNYDSTTPEIRNQILVQTSTLIYVVTDLRTHYTDERMVLYFDMLESDAKWKLLLIQNADH